MLARDKIEYSSVLIKRKEILFHASKCLILEDIILSELSQSQERNATGIHLYEFFKLVKFIKTERQVVVLKGRGTCPVGVEFPFCKVKKF